MNTIASSARILIVFSLLATAGGPAAMAEETKSGARPTFGVDDGSPRPTARTDEGSDALLSPGLKMSPASGQQRSAGFVYKPSASLSFYGVRASGFGVASATASTSRFGRDNPTLDYWLRPRAYGEAEVGFKAKLSNGLVASVAAFRSDSEEEFGSRLGPAAQYTGRTRRDGVELGLGGRWGNGFAATVNYALVRNTFSDAYCGAACASFTRGVGAPRSAPEQVLSGELSWRYPRFGLVTALEAKYVGRGEDFVSDRTTAYFVANARLGLEQQAGRWRIQEFARVDNLTGRSLFNPTTGDSGFRLFDPAANRNYSIGISAGYTW